MNLTFQVSYILLYKQIYLAFTALVLRVTRSKLHIYTRRSSRLDFIPYDWPLSFRYVIHFPSHSRVSLSAHRTQISACLLKTMLLRRAVLSTRAPLHSRRTIPFHRQFSSSLPKRGQIEITIDGKKVMVEQGAALIQACEIAGVQIPR